MGSEPSQMHYPPESRDAGALTEKRTTLGRWPELQKRNKVLLASGPLTWR